MEEFVKEIREGVEKYNLFRQRVMDECNVGRMAFYSWSHGEPISKKYKPIIDRIAMEIYGKSVFFTEEGGAR